jgi:hypothetical protein
VGGRSGEQSWRGGVEDARGTWRVEVKRLCCGRMLLEAGAVRE